jgi:hypothetical protein
MLQRKQLRKVVKEVSNVFAGDYTYPAKTTDR